MRRHDIMFQDRQCEERIGNDDSPEEEGHRLFQFGKGRRTKGVRQAAAIANLSAPTSRGGMVSVASLAAALLTPQITTIAMMARISTGESGL